tara:strand:- start:5127 stop:5324 length:198 start_codon:yes stop_codon:yes gene_type:complete
MLLSAPWWQELALLLLVIVAVMLASGLQDEINNACSHRNKYACINFTEDYTKEAARKKQGEAVNK